MRGVRLRLPLRGRWGNGDGECSFVITVSEEERTVVALTLVVGEG